MGRRRGGYLGGSTIVRAAPVGVKTSTKRRSKSKRDAAETNREYERRQQVIAAEKIALRRFEITDGDRVAIGMKASGWTQYADVLLGEISILRRCGIHGVDRIATIWNKKGFKTGAGRRWTPRLVKVAQSLSPRS